MRPEGRIFTSCDDDKAQQKEEMLLFFPGQDSANK